MPQVGTVVEDTKTEAEAPATDTSTPPTSPAKASKKADKPKGTKKAAKAIKKAPKATKKASKKATPKPTVEPAKPIAALQKGGTRMRCFLALAKYPNGLSAKAIKEKTGMLPVSGHLAVILGEEIKKKRIKADDARTYTKANGEEGKEPTIYTLTALGKKAIEKNEVDGRKTGSKIGNEWTTARVKAEKPAKAKKAAKKKAK